MARRGLAGVLVALLASLNTVGFLRAARDESCACIKAACCCRPAKDASARACHSPGSEAPDTGLRCRHPSDALQLTATMAVLAPPQPFTPLRRARPGAAPRAGRLLDGFSRLHSPPPRPLA